MYDSQISQDIEQQNKKPLMLNSSQTIYKQRNSWMYSPAIKLDGNCFVKKAYLSIMAVIVICTLDGN